MWKQTRMLEVETVEVLRVNGSSCASGSKSSEKMNASKSECGSDQDDWN